MGNNRFRLADMIPNTWPFKLKEMGGRSKATQKNMKKKQPPPTSSSPSSSSSSSSSVSSTKQPNPLSHRRKSYYFTRDLTGPDPPGKSSKQTRQRTRFSDPPPPQRLVATTVSAGCSCRNTTSDSFYEKPDSTSEEYPNSSLYSSSDPESLLPEFGSDHDPAVEPENDIVIDMNENTTNPKLKVDGFDSIAELKLELPPIITHKLDHNPSSESTKFTTNSSQFEEKKTYGSLSVKITKNGACRERRTSPVLRGLRLKNSPRIVRRRVRGGAQPWAGSRGRRRRSLSESFAVVKSSEDPQRDFRESMVEMIMENNIRASKDLEDLLACYLQLNSDEHHEMIINVFKQIWFDLAGVRLK